LNIVKISILDNNNEKNAWTESLQQSGDGYKYVLNPTKRPKIDPQLNNTSSYCKL